MNWIQQRWRRLRFNRLNFQKSYVVDQVLSQKPRSSVLLVRRTGGSQQTVMKLCDPAAVNPLERQCLRSLRHPRLISYLGHGFTRDGRAWTELEYIDGVALPAWLDERGAGHPPASHSLTNRDVFLQLLSLVQYLHSCGWLHGDLSPQNVLVSPQRGVVLVDFEYARRIDTEGESAMRRRHSLSFASPHEIAGGATTEACEQFALGKLGMLLLGHGHSAVAPRFNAPLSQATSQRPQDRYPGLHRLEMELRDHTQPADGGPS